MDNGNDKKLIKIDEASNTNSKLAGKKKKIKNSKKSSEGTVLQTVHLTAESIVQNIEAKCNADDCNNRYKKEFNELLNHDNKEFNLNEENSYSQRLEKDLKQIENQKNSNIDKAHKKMILKRKIDYDSEKKGNLPINHELNHLIKKENNQISPNNVSSEFA